MGDAKDAGGLAAADAGADKAAADKSAVDAKVAVLANSSLFLTKPHVFSGGSQKMYEVRVIVTVRDSSLFKTGFM